MKTNVMPGCCWTSTRGKGHPINVGCMGNHNQGSQGNLGRFVFHDHWGGGDCLYARNGSWKDKSGYPEALFVGAHLMVRNAAVHAICMYHFYSKEKG